ncbi:MAG TPA: response regulator [Verrucomicrobiae bacterium]|nr:response regulator [Verrucomicrobiae bacterium]
MAEPASENPIQEAGAHILVIEDREEDIFFLRRAFRSVDPNVHITDVPDGEEGIKYLSREAPYTDPARYPVPDVVVLDLKMPKKDGFEVLQWLREQNLLKPAPVVVLTSSTRDEDLKRAKELGAGRYYAKPVDFSKLVGVAKDINRRWLSRRRNLGLLIVDDDENDRLFLRHAFEKLNAGYQIFPLESGNKAVAFIKGEGIYADRKTYPFPTFILTDLKMPEGDGFEILHYLKQHPESLIVPVVMLSGSDDPDDVRQAYLLGVSSFIVKPQGLHDLELIVQKLHYYWSECELPPVDPSGNALTTSSTGKLAERFDKSKKPS